MAMRRARNLGLLVLIVAVTYVLLDRAIISTGLTGGLSLTTLVMDEFRINLLPTPSWMPCSGNRTHLPPGCTQLYHGYGNLGYGTWLPATTVAINKEGFRGPSPGAPKVNMYKILALGDSVTFGAGVEAEEAYPAVLEKMLNERSESTEFEVLNLGIPGGNTHTEYQVLLRFLEYEPDLIILQTLNNDMIECDLFQQAELQRLGAAALKQQALQDYTLDFPVKDRCACVWHYMDSIEGLTKIPLLIYGVGNMFGCLPHAGNHSFLMSSGFLSERKYVLSRMDWHPNREGHRRMAEELLPAVLEISRGETCAADALGMEVVPCH